MEKQFQIQANNFLDGYQSLALFRKPTELAPPSQNVRITLSGQAEKRPGYLNVGWTLGAAGYAATSFYNERYDLTFFALSTKVFYIDHGDSNRVVDTGITLTTGTTTRFSEYAGDIYLTNTTDGLRHIVVTKLAAACTTGDTKITLDTDGVARLKFFSLTSGNLRIRGTNEAYVQPTTGSVTATASAGGLIRITSNAHKLVTGCQVVISGVTGTTEANGTWTVTRNDANTFDLQGSTYANAWISGGTWTYNLNGIVALTSTASADYPNQTTAIVVSDISSGRPKGSKVTFWKERMTIAGCLTDPTVGKADANIYFSKFALSTSLENIVNFSLDGTGGSESELVGKSGAIKNVIATKSFLYVLKKSEVYSIAVGEVNSESGSSPPSLLTENYGCLNEDSACEMNGNLVWITNNKRILATQFQVFSTGSVAVPNEEFDLPIRLDLQKMDDSQPNALAFYHKGKKLLYCQVSVQGEIWTFVYDNNIGKWLPPDKNKSFKSYFERNGALYATALNEQTIYEMDSGTNDDGILIDCRIATGIFQYAQGRVTCAWDEVEMGGIVSQPASIQIQAPVDGGTPAIKNVLGTSYAYTALGTIGSQIGTMIGGQTSGQATATWGARFDVYPSEGNQLQIITSSFDDGTYGVNSYKITARVYPESIFSLS
jgi:hypothetical protein